MRLFLAIDLPAPVLLRLERLLCALRSEAHVKWSPLDNLHVTTKFIGEWPESRFSELTEALEGLGALEPFQIELKNLGWFPAGRSPRVLCLNVAENQALTELANRMDGCLEKLGVVRETREYSPHLTLARLKNPVPLERLKQRVAELQPANMGAFSASSYGLFRSDPGSNASVYRKLREFRLEAAMAAS